MKSHYALTIKATNRPGLLHSVTGIINRRLICIKSLNAAPTDVHEIVLITIEIQIAEKDLKALTLRLENIVEIFSVDAIRYDKAICRRSCFFKLDKRMLTGGPQAIVISKWDAQIISMQGNTVLIYKSGSEDVIRRLYNELDGPYLLGFSQTGLIVDSRLIEGDESSVISRLAA